MLQGLIIYFVKCIKDKFEKNNEEEDYVKEERIRMKKYVKELEKEAYRINDVINLTNDKDTKLWLCEVLYSRVTELYSRNKTKLDIERLSELYQRISY